MRFNFLLILFINNTIVMATILKTLAFNCKPYQYLLDYDYSRVKNTTREPNMNLVKVHLYNGTETEIYSLTNASSPLLDSSLFDINLPLMIYIHGFLNTMESASVTEIVNAFKTRGGYNVMALDPHDFIRLNYITAITNVRFIGEGLAGFLAEIIEKGVPASNIHLVGHSLGAHISGFAGKALTRTTGKNIGRISGLDVAGPCFYEVSNDDRLYKTDADFVDVIHSDAGDLGIYQSIGHVDFYPNGGLVQPRPLLQFPDSHGGAWMFFAISVTNPTGFKSVECSNFWGFFKNNCGNHPKTYMGYGASGAVLSGNYYLLTSPRYPYYLKDAGIRPSNLFFAFFGFL